MSSDIERTPSPSPTDERRFRSKKVGPDGRLLGLSCNIENSPAERYWVAKASEESYTMKHSALATSGPSVFKTRMDHRHDPSVPAPPGISHPILHTGHSNGTLGQRRPRPETSHQKAVNMNRKMRIEHILHRQMVNEHMTIRWNKKSQSSSFGFTAMKRIKDLPDGYDTEHELSWGPGGLVPNPDEDEDFGEEALRQKKVIDRAVRRLLREEADTPLEGLVTGYRKRKRKDEVRYAISGDSDNRTGQVRDRGRDQQRRERAGQRNRPGKNQNDNSGVGVVRRRERSEGERREEGLDDLDLDLLGESRDDDHEDEMMEEYSEMENDSEGDDGTEEES